MGVATVTIVHFGTLRQLSLWKVLILACSGRSQVIFTTFSMLSCARQVEAAELFMLHWTAHLLQALPYRATADLHAMTGTTLPYAVFKERVACLGIVRAQVS